MNCACFFVLLVCVSGVYSHHWKLFDKDGMGSKVINMMQTIFFPDLGGKAQGTPKRNRPAAQPPTTPSMDCPTMTTVSPQKQNGDSRPCMINDIDCMRQFLSSNSKCYITEDRTKDNPKFENLMFDLRGFNMTFFAPVLLTSGFKSAKIVEFSVSAFTNNLVIGIHLQSIHFEAQDTVLYIQRRAQESVIKSTSISADTPSFTLTAIIPSVPNLRLEDAEIHSYFEAPPQNIKLGIATEPMDELTQSVLQSMLANQDLVLREAIQSRVFAYYIIQNLLCDFGLS